MASFDQGEPDYSTWLAALFESEDQRWEIPVVDRVEESPRAAVEYLTRLFTESASLARSFTRDQIGRGFYYVVSNNFSHYAFALLDRSIPLAARVECIHRIADVYRDLFAQICYPFLGHLGRQEDVNADRNEANSICYMWWDVFPMHARTRNPQTKLEPDVRDHVADHAAIERACLVALERSLETGNDACIEGALHGLGHWADYAEVTVPIIDGFLQRRPGLRPELHEYAMAARAGMVL